MGGALYRTSWRARRSTPLHEWLNRAVQRLRWLDSGGAEWDLLRATTRYNTAYHTLRLLPGGAHRRARHRSRDTRREHPHLCAGCELPHITLSWRTPHPDRQGLAWCANCSPFGEEAPARRLLTELSHQEHGAASAGQSPDIGNALEGAIHHHGGTHHDWGPSPFGACPLCGCGEG